MSKLSEQRKRVLLALVLLMSSLIHNVDASSESSPTPEAYLAPGWGKLSFDAPLAGSYNLPAIGQAEDGAVLKSNGDPARIHKLMDGKVTVLSFVYRTCDDVNGCPLSTMVLYTLGNRIAEDPALKDRMRMLTVSFDPEFDTPDVMAEYGESILGDADIDWEFLTTNSETELAPILKDYQQSVVKDRRQEESVEKERNRFSHILRVYLIDEQKQIRNIYSLSFLHPDILVNDVKTLVMEADAASAD